MTKLQELKTLCDSCNLHYDSYSPGDGITRYRFFTESQGYFQSQGLITVLGITQAILFAEGYSLGYHAKQQ